MPALPRPLTLVRQLAILVASVSVVTACRSQASETPSARPNPKPNTVQDARDVTSKSQADAEVAALLQARDASSLALVLKLDDGTLLASAQHKLEPANAVHEMRTHPASTVKPLVAWHMLDAGHWPQPEVIECRGERKGVPHPCFAEHGQLDLAKALATSCNTYLQTKLDHTPKSEVIAGLRAFDLPAPDTTSEDRLREMAHGHGPLEVAPIEIGRAYAKLARHLKTAPRDHPVRRGLAATVHDVDGSAHTLAERGLDLVGKTGSARLDEDPSGKIHGWFVGLYPTDDPQIAVLSYTYGAGIASRLAVPLAGDIVEHWARTHMQPS